MCINGIYCIVSSTLLVNLARFRTGLIFLKLFFFFSFFFKRVHSTDILSFVVSHRREDVVVVVVCIFIVPF